MEAIDLCLLGLAALILICGASVAEIEERQAKEDRPVMAREG